MKPIIIIAATAAAFVTAVNKAIAESDVPLTLADADHQEGRLAAVLEPDAKRAKLSSGTLLEISAVSGDQTEIRKKLEAEENPYVKPLRLFVKPAGKSDKVSALLILGQWQP